MSKLFPIGLEVEEVAVGRVLRELNGMTGVAKINLNLTGQRRNEIADETVESVQRALPAPTRKYKRMSGAPVGRGFYNQVIAEALRGGQLSLKQLTTFALRRGLSPQSVSPRLNDMKVRNYARRVGPGVWELTPTGMKDFFGDQNSPSLVSNESNIKSGPSGTRKQVGKYKAADNSIGVRRTVLDLLRDGPRTTAELTKVIVEHGNSPKNMSGTVYKMRVDHPALVKLSNGMYSLTPHGQKEIDRIIQAEQQSQSQPQAAE